MEKPSKPFLVECRSCQAVVSTQRMAGYSALIDGDIPQRFSFGMCPQCSSPLLVGEEWYGNQGEVEVWSDPYRLYPPPDDILSPGIPKGVRQSHSEALRCFKAQAHSATAIMCRRTLERACAEHGINEQNLAESLAAMKAEGLIEARMLEWADALRIAGKPSCPWR